MNATLALRDDEFVDAFETGRLPEGFPHRAHVRLAWLYVRRYGAAEASERVAAGIRRLAAAEGVPGKFHETMTRAWVYAIAAGDEPSAPDDFDAFTTANPHVLDRGLLARHYTRDALENGRSSWVPPDLEPIPGAPSTAIVPREQDVLSAGDVFRLIPSAVSVVTARDGAFVHGATVGSVTGLSRDPELVLACLRNSSRLLELIRASGAFAISFLAQGQHQLAAHFADPKRPPGVAQFRGIRHRGSAAGPVLSESAAWLECELRAEYAGGDHTIVSGEVLQAGVEPHQPLLRWNGGWVGA